MAKEEIYQLIVEGTVTVVKYIPAALLAGTTAIVNYMVLYVNGRKVSKWKMFASTLIAVFLGGYVSYLLDGQKGFYVRIAPVASGLIGEKVLVWLSVNGITVIGDIYKVLIGRIGGKNSQE